MNKILLLGIILSSSIVYGNDINEALINAAKNGNLKEVKALIKKGADVNAINEDYDNPLDIAIFMENVAIVKLLIDNGVDVNIGYYEGQTPLMYASRKGLLDIAKLLIGAGAQIEIDVEDFSGYTALIWASETGHTDIVKLLIANGADVNYKSSEGRTALNTSLDFDNKEMIKLLKDVGATR